MAGTDTTLDAFVQGEVGDEEVRWGGDEGGEGGVEEGVWRVFRFFLVYAVYAELGRGVF